MLGYRMRGGCGSEVVLETVNAPRAFLTTDSGFPLAELEQALRTNRPFTYDYQPTAVPVLYSAGILAERQGKGRRANSSMLSSAIPRLCRLYLGMSKLDPRNRRSARRTAHCRRSLQGLSPRAGFLRRQCSRFATARRWFPAAQRRRRPGTELAASLRKRRRPFSRS